VSLSPGDRLPRRPFNNDELEGSEQQFFCSPTTTSEHKGLFVLGLVAVLPTRGTGPDVEAASSFVSGDTHKLLEHAPISAFSSDEEEASLKPELARLSGEIDTLLA
jgi:hypothetical protein